MTSSTKKRVRPDLSKVDWKRIDATTGRDIAGQIERDADTAPEASDEEWARAQLVLPEPKTQLTLRVDTDVLRGFKNSGPGYQQRINQVLRQYAVDHGWIDRRMANAQRGRGRPKTKKSA